MPVIVDAQAMLAWWFEDEWSADSTPSCLRARVDGLLVPCI